MNDELEKKFHRVLVLTIFTGAIVFALYSLWYSGAAPTENTHGFQVQPLGQGFAPVGDDTTPMATPKKLPSPDTYRHYDLRELAVLTIDDECRDMYYAVLVYPSTIDYRDHAAGAIVNKALLCPKNKEFSLSLSDEVVGIPAGMYYVIVADQGPKGTWYNPR